jgi:hypothetical protein
MRAILDPGHIGWISGSVKLVGAAGTCFAAGGWLDGAGCGSAGVCCGVAAAPEKSNERIPPGNRLSM